LWFFVSKFTEFDSKKLLKIYRRGLHTNEKFEKDTKIKDKIKTKDKHKDDKKVQKSVSCTML
jgi:chromodomain-helicase-DNA-binding protein 1